MNKHERYFERILRLIKTNLIRRTFDLISIIPRFIFLVTSVIHLHDFADNLLTDKRRQMNNLIGVSKNSDYDRHNDNYDDNVKKRMSHSESITVNFDDIIVNIYSNLLYLSAIPPTDVSCNVSRTQYV